MYGVLFVVLCRFLESADDGGVEGAPLLDAGEVALAAVHRVVVPGLAAEVTWCREI